MPDRVPQTDPWSCWHLHVETFEPRALNDVVLDVVRPVVSEVAGHPSFFVRYWQGGPHVRLRVCGLAAHQQEAVDEGLRQRLALVNAAVPASARVDDTIYQAAVSPTAAAGENGHALPVEPLRRAGVYRAGYEPELARYGGPALMDVSHALFTTASELAVVMLAGRRDGAAGTLAGVGLYCTAAALSAVPVGGTGVDGLTRFLRLREEFWLDWARRSGAVVDRGAHQAACRAGAERLAEAPERVLSLIREPTGPARDWSAQLSDAAGRWQAASARLPAAAIISSHLHMLHNRLGIGLRSESYVTGVLAEFLCLVRERHPTPVGTARVPERR